MRGKIFFPLEMTLDQAHGRHDTREVFVFEVTAEETGFPHAAQGALVIRTSHHLKKVKVTEDVQFVITSRSHEKLNQAQFLKALRGHWSIENKLHYPRDVTFQEDLSTARTGNSQQNLAALRNLVIGLGALCHSHQISSHSYLPGFRRNAQNYRAPMLRLITRPLAEALRQ